MINYKLVYLDTGRLVPNQDQYTVKLSKSGRQTIYRKGKMVKWDKTNPIYAKDEFIGYVNKGTKAQQANIERIEKGRIHRNERKFTKNPKSVYDVKAINYTSKSFYDMVYEKAYTQGRSASEVPVKVKSLTNYVNYLNNAMNAGFITEQDALEWYQKYKDATTDDARNELWKEVKQFAIERGYADSY